MAAKVGVPSEEEIALPTISSPKHHDFAVKPTDHTISDEVLDDATRPDSDSSDGSATDSAEEFNWDEEDEDMKKNGSKEASKAKRFRFLWLAFMKLSRFIRTVIVGVLGVGVLITPLLVFQFCFHNNVARPQVHVWSLWLAVVWAAACVTYLAVDLVPKLFISLVVLFGYKVERLRVQIELIFAISGWLKLVLDVSWAWIALSVIRPVYKPSGSYWTIVNRVMQALFSAAVIIFVEKVFLHLIAINFHEKALSQRLAENRLGLKALDRLSNAQPSQTAKRNPYNKSKGHKGLSGSFDVFGGIGKESRSGVHDGHGHTHSHNASSSSSPVREKETPNGVHIMKQNTAERKRKRKKVMASVIVDQLGDAIGQVALKNSKFNREHGSGDLYSARKLAKKLFNSLSHTYPRRDYLIVDDFVPYFKTTADAHAAFALFDKDGNGDITKKEMREAVQRIYRERKALVSSLKDVSSAVAKLDAVLLSVALIILIFVFLLIFNKSDTLSSLVPLATIILGFSFVFGNSAKTLFESLIFIFATHVFDVGDLVMIDDQVLFVKEFGLFSTTFRRVDGQEIIAPNALLSSSKLIHNLRRSNSMWESTNLTISYNTSLELVEQLKSKLNQYVVEHNREWSGVIVNIDKMEYQNAIYIVVAMEHRPNWQDWGGRWVRRNAFMRYLKSVLEELNLTYIMPTQPVLMGPPGGRRGNFYSNPGGRGPNGGGSIYNGRGGGSIYSGTPRVAPRALRDDLGNAGLFQGSKEMIMSPTAAIAAGESQWKY